MSGANDFVILAARDYTLCCKVEEDFLDEYAVTAACYHMQQSIEKLLKALIISRGEIPEFTHNITKLAKRCIDLEIELPEMLDDISDTLTMWESSVRNDPSIVFSEKKYSKAKSVYSDLKTQISNILDGCKNDEIDDGESEGLQPIRTRLRTMPSPFGLRFAISITSCTQHNTTERGIYPGKIAMLL